MGKQETQDESSLTFSSKEDILEWGKNKYGISFSGKFDELSFNDKEYLIFYGNYGHGIIYTDIYILSYKSGLDKTWRVETKKTSKNKYNFKANYDEAKRGILVTTEDGEVVLVFPI
jgi:hypothetical protein